MPTYAGPDSDLVPDAGAIRAFCAWWFQFANKGVIEIGWLDAEGRGLVHFEQFARDDLDALAATAVQANLVPGQACYVRAATVLPWTAGSHRTTDMDFEQAPGIWGDIDTPEQFEQARTVQTIVRPNGQVITGTVPHMRVQSWFRTSEPIASPELVRSLNVRLHKLYGGDSSVVNPSRLMRLPGTIAWPWKVGRAPEITQFVRPPPDDPRPASYPISLLTSQLPGGADHEQQRTNGAESPRMNGHISSGAFGLGGGVTVSAYIQAIRAGHEWHNNVIRLVAHWVSRGWSSLEILTASEAFTLPGFTHDQTRREVGKAIEGARVKWQQPDIDQDVSGQTKRPAILSLTELDALPPPEWLIAGLVPEQSLVVPFGPPKQGKTFIMLSIALHIAADLPWFGHAVKGGAVVYIAGEGVGGLSLRLRAMRAHYAISSGIPFWIIPRAVNFRNPAEVNILEALIRETIGAIPLRLLAVDTLARAMPGADENSAQEVGLIISAADYLKDALGCTVALVHHEGKDGERGARGTSALRGAWDAAYRIIQQGKQTILSVVDQKDAEGGQRLAFSMTEVAVGLGRTSLVPVLDAGSEVAEGGAGRPGSYPPRAINGHAGLVLQTLQNLLAGPESAVLPPFSGVPSGDIRGVAAEVLRRGVYEKMPTNSPEARQKAFVRSIQLLQQRGLIGVRDPWVWMVG